jgi:hypothetical protein
MPQETHSSHVLAVLTEERVSRLRAKIRIEGVWPVLFWRLPWLGPLRSRTVRSKLYRVINTLYSVFRVRHGLTRQSAGRGDAESEQTFGRCWWTPHGDDRGMYRRTMVSLGSRRK